MHCLRCAEEKGDRVRHLCLSFESGFNNNTCAAWYRQQLTLHAGATKGKESVFLKVKRREVWWLLERRAAAGREECSHDLIGCREKGSK